MDFILRPADPERQRALPEDPGPCPHCGARAWRRNGTYPRHLVAHHLRRARPLRPRQAAWYAKTLPTFSDALACVRHTLWTQAPPFSLSPATLDIRKRPQPPLLAALCYSA